MSTITLLLIACSSPSSKAQYACYGSCDVQSMDCPSIDLVQCYGLCDWVIESTKDTDGCLEAHTQVWGCDATIEWTCNPNTNVIAQPVDDACLDQHNNIPVECIP